MTVPFREISRNTYEADGIASVFPYTFKVLQTEQLIVTVVDTAGVETTKVEDTDYTVLGEGDDGGGRIVFVTASIPLFEEVVTIIPAMPFTQAQEFEANDSFDAVEYERSLDQAAIEIQQLNEALGRATTINKAEGDIFTSELPAGASARDLIQVNATTTGLETIDPKTVLDNIGVVRETFTLSNGEAILGGGDLTANRIFRLAMQELDDTIIPELTDSLLGFDKAGDEHARITLSNLPGTTPATGNEWVKIETQVASSDNFITFLGLEIADFHAYKVFVVNALPSDDDVEFTCLLRRLGQVNFDVTGGDYDSTVITQGDASGNKYVTVGDHIKLSGAEAAPDKTLMGRGMSNTTSLCGEMNILRPQDALEDTKVDFKGAYSTESEEPIVSKCYAVHKQAEAVDAIRFLFGVDGTLTGTIDSGTFVLYGLTA